jgi:hypothetical protein
MGGVQHSISGGWSNYPEGYLAVGIAKCSISLRVCGTIATPKFGRTATHKSDLSDSDKVQSPNTWSQIF